MRINHRSWMPIICGLLLVSAGRAQDAAIPQPSVPVVEKVTLSTLDEHEAIMHQIVDHHYEVEIVYKKSMLGVKKLELSINSPEPGQWSKPVMTSGSTLTTRRTGNKEPRGCIVESTFTIDKDPAAKFLTDTVQRITGESSALDPVSAKNETNRLVEEYARTQNHVLKLPRFASSRLNPEDTLRRLCLWVYYDKLFRELKLDTRPAITPSNAEKTYRQVLGILRGDQPPEGESEPLISTEELERIREAYLFTYSVQFVPHLADDQTDQNWRKAAQVSFDGDQVGRVAWSGELGQGHHSTAWLAYLAGTADGKLDVTSVDPSPDLKWSTVKGPEDWLYLRLKNVAKKTPTKFQMRISGSGGAPEIQITQSKLQVPKFPF